jgi:hypothetical protein
MTGSARVNLPVGIGGLILTIALRLQAVEPCRIEVVEKGSGWPVPLVELRTTHQIRFVTDNAGRIAFDAPELMGREVWFDVSGHGYGVATDGLGQRGVRLRPESGKVLRVEVDRTMVARRLGRITGSGLFAESVKLGLEKEARESGVLGCDSVLNAVHRGRLFWVWGDTTLAGYPLGIFDATGATSPVQPLSRFEPPLRMSLDLFTDTAGLPRAIARMPGSGPTWLTGLVSVADRDGAMHLVAAYSKIRPPLEAYEWSLCEWNEATSNFEPIRTVWTQSASAPKPPPLPEGHAVLWKDDAGREWLLFGNPLPALKCPASYEGWRDPEKWEVLKPQTTLESAADGRPVKPHTGSIAWNAFRKRWVTVFMEAFGKPSAFGELWYAEAESPLGPWGRTVKVLSHENYTFYNPVIHPGFTPADSPVLLFEGTYTMMFADKPTPTARYDYNQILYRLDLDDPALAPARGGSGQGTSPLEKRAGMSGTGE